MFERRLKVFLFVLAIVTAVLIGRAVDLQILGREHWVEEAAKSLHHETLTETTRGRLLDVRGRPLAEDEYCFDACVDYPAIPREPDPDWVHEIAYERIKSRIEGQHDKTVSVKSLVKDEVVQVKADIDTMWARLAQEGGMTQDQMDDLRQSIVQDVEMRRRYTWYRNYLRAQRAAHPGAATQSIDAGTVEPWYRKWLQGETDVAPVDTFDIKIGEQTQKHVILRAIPRAVYNELGKEQERFPGFELKPGMERSYPLPYAEAACHVLGRLTRVDQNDLNDDPWVGDSLRAYTRSDLIGRGGLEELCEPLLRGTRGRLVEQLTGEESADAESGISASQESVVEAIPGQDVRTTIDVDLEQDIRAAFDHLNVKRDKKDPDLFADLHGAAVVIDIPTGEVRAMVSAPGFDPNMSDRAIAALNDDELNKPLFNRATCSMPETGSTIKPVVGIGAITQGVMGINDTIECTGFLTIQGREVSGGARCWTLSKFGFSRDDPRASHHRIPDTDPHPTGFLTFSDALQRSCNVFFENMGYRLGVDGLSKWMKKFGLGRITGVGIPEVRGRLPDLIPAKDIAVRSVNALWGGIGQGCVGATPIQMANVAATIARNGIWMRPRLVNDDVSRQLRAIASRLPTTQPSWTDVPDGPVDLQLSPPAVAAAQDGMWRVVNTKAGTGNELFRGDLQISGKTGTAQATPFSIPMRDRFGREIYDGAKAKTFYPEPSTPEKPNPLAPWYLGFEDKGSDKIELKHSWYIGFAPSHNPKIAFAVLVEYGGSGGNAAGTIAKRIIDECVERGYVPLDTQIREEVP